MLPTIRASIAPFLVRLNRYTSPAEMAMVQPNTRLANSPTNPVLVGFNTSFTKILTTSMMAPATGPRAKVPTSTGTSLMSSP